MSLTRAALLAPGKRTLHLLSIDTLITILNHGRLTTPTAFDYVPLVLIMLCIYLAVEI
jgi:hypothetical protein